MSRKEILFGLLIAVFVALIFSPFASPWPDGLEKVAEDKGFIIKSEVSPTLPAPIPDYVFPGIKNEKIATSMAGVVGTMIIFGVGYGLAVLLKRSKNQ